MSSLFLSRNRTAQLRKMAKEGIQLHSKEFFGVRLSHLTDKSTEEEVVVVYDDWASNYDHVS